MARNERRSTRKQGFNARKENTRSERIVDNKDDQKMVFSFKDFDCTQKFGQTYREWQENGLLAYMLEEFGHFCQWTRVEAEQEDILEVYGNFPKSSKFKHPKHIATDVEWAVIRNVKGQKGRVAGYVIGNVFYVVFLDMDHQFWKTKR